MFYMSESIDNKNDIDIKTELGKYYKIIRLELNLLFHLMKK